MWPASGLAAANAGLQNLTTTGIFIISGLGLRRGEVLQQFSASFWALHALCSCAQKCLCWALHYQYRQSWVCLEQVMPSSCAGDITQGAIWNLLFFMNVHELVAVMLQAMRALSAWGATLYGCVAILALTPLAAYAALALPLAPRELAVGLAVFCCMPTTLSSGVSLTQVG